MRGLPCGTALVSAVMLAGCVSGGVLPPPDRGIVVNGVGRVSARPDTAVASIGVEARAPRLADATAEVDRTMREVLARLKAPDGRVADVRTLVYSIDPIAEPRQPADASARIVGYHVSNIVQVRTGDVEGLSRIVDGAVAAGANFVRDVRFTLDDASASEAQARALAMRDAVSRARQLATAAGVTLGKLVSVRDASPVRPVTRMALAGGPGPVESGQLEVIVSLEARYEIEP
jgi:uncharacterized protein YggE